MTDVKHDREGEGAEGGGWVHFEQKIHSANVLQSEDAVRPMTATDDAQMLSTLHYAAIL